MKAPAQTRSPSLLLTQAQREQFTRFPVLDERLLAQYYLLGESDLARDELPPSEVLEFLAEQIGVDVACYVLYAARQNTRHEHFAELCQRLGYVELSRRLNLELRAWLLPQAIITEQAFPLIVGVMDELRRRKILVARIQVLERLVGGAGQG